ncbi:MAG: hypothetical protein Q9211_005759 [Gyalolechia sp. 1 TL-2023]
MGVFGTGQLHDAPMAVHLFDVYVQYKKDTRAIILWLLSHQQTDHVRSQKLSVRDLLAIAECICAKAITMPDIIAFHFRQAIAARNYLSKIFRKASTEKTVAAATENHEFFTSRYFLPFTHQWVLNRTIQNIHKVFSEVECVWQKLAHGSSSLITATAVTNTAYALLENIEHRLATSHNISDPSDLLETCLKLPDNVNSAINIANTGKPAIQTIRDLDGSGQAMMNLRRVAANKDNFIDKILNPHAPPQISLRKGPDVSASDSHCRSVLLSNVAQCLSSSRLQNTFIRSGSPIVPELSFFMSREKTATNCLHCASGLSLLMSSYKAYSFALPTGQSPSHCRVQALRFAQDATTHISAVLHHPSMPCRCHGTLAFHLESLKQDIEEYLHTKMFDFYFQSPWVCGAHILEMLHALHYYGLRLCAYRSYVGSVVHMYNVLRQLHDLAPIPVLEALCEQLAELFFPGGRPRKSFKNCYVRYMGGRLRFHAKARHQNGCHGLVIPAHAARANAGFRSVEEEKDGRERTDPTPPATTPHPPSLPSTAISPPPSPSSCPLPSSTTSPSTSPAHASSTASATRTMVPR